MARASLPAWRAFAFASLLACGTSVDLGGGAPPDAAVDARMESGTCATFAPPDASAPCRGCDEKSSTCQPNGCYGGYFCEASEPDCKAPGTACKSSK